MKITILGTGAYGIALATVLHSNKHKIDMWTKYQEEVDSILLNRENKRLLPGVIISEDIKVSSNMEDCVKGSEIIIIAVPMNAVRDVSKELSNYLTEEQIICIVTKGMEMSTGKKMSEVVNEETASNNICMLSGPSFAIEMANMCRLGLVAASKNIDVCYTVERVFENENISIAISEDIAGVEILASAKNIFAIIMGMLDGASESTRATMLTILLNDLRLICEVLGGKASTIFTYAGLGDFLLTCMNMKSRNYTFGSLIAKGNTKEKAFEIMNMTTVEGLYSLDSIYNLLKDRQIDIKSIEILHNILYNNGQKEDILQCLK